MLSAAWSSGGAQRFERWVANREAGPFAVRRSKGASALAVLFLTGCMTQQGYDGPKLARDEVAHISGDLRFTAGIPVSALLRQVDGRTLSVSQSGVDVTPGDHKLLVDCRVQETGETSRFELDVSVAAGERYRLVPETGPGLRDCVAVRFEEQE